MDILMKLEVKDKMDNFIRKNIVLFNSFKNVYLFGSILNINKVPNDIDILLIYEKFSSDLIDEINIIRSTLENLSGFFIDLTVLSVEEEKEVKFLKWINKYDGLYNEVRHLKNKKLTMNFRVK